MKIYTRTGDQGETGLLGGPRVRKDDPRIEAYGTVDELNSVLGLAAAQLISAELAERLARLQAELFELGAELASPDPRRQGTSTLGGAQVEFWEADIDRMEATLPPLKQFILPGGAAAAGWLHLARTVCRRAERRVITLADCGPSVVAPVLIVYLNRVSDWLFVAARWANAQAGVPDVPWAPRLPPTP